MAQIMAHETTGASDVINIPVSVVFERSACVWSVRSSTKEWVLRGGKQVRPQRLGEKAPPSPILKWQLGDDPEAPINIDPDLPKRALLDPWQVRKSFLAVSSDSEMLEFLNQTGSFDGRTTGKAVWGFDDFREWQAVVKQMLRLHPANWRQKLPDIVRDQRKLTFISLTSRLPINFLWDRAKPYGVITTQNTLSAMLATVFIDRLRGARIKFCARPDCKKEFRVVSNHERDYCRPYCAHLESLRRLRARRKRQAKENGAIKKRGRLSPH